MGRLMEAAGIAELAGQDPELAAPLAAEAGFAARALRQFPLRDWAAGRRGFSPGAAIPGMVAWDPSAWGRTRLPLGGSRTGLPRRPRAMSTWRRRMQGTPRLLRRPQQATRAGPRPLRPPRVVRATKVRSTTAARTRGPFRTVARRETTRRPPLAQRGIVRDP